MDDTKVQIRIKDTTLTKLDQSDWSKEYYDEKNNVSYQINGNRIISVPQVVADAWIAIDSTIERVSDPLLS